MKQFPLARRDQLVIQELPDELLVYYQQRDRAHCLNRSAALIWKSCDGKTSVEEISRKVAKELETRSMIAPSGSRSRNLPRTIC